MEYITYAGIALALIGAGGLVFYVVEWIGDLAAIFYRPRLDLTDHKREILAFKRDQQRFSDMWSDE